MLIDFSVTNFRSVKTAVTLSAIPSSTHRSESDEKVTMPFIFPKRDVAVLPVIGLFGANASGKSTVLDALDQLFRYMTFSRIMRTGGMLFLDPFALDRVSKSKPTTFTATFIRKHVYTYRLALDRSGIVSEELRYIPADANLNRSRLLFRRDLAPENKNFVTKKGSDLGNPFGEILKASTRNKTFLSVLINDLVHPVTKPLADWLSFYILTTGLGTLEQEIADCADLLQNAAPELKAPVFKLLQYFDTGIFGLEYHKLEDSNEFAVEVVHKNRSFTATWPMWRESLGTQKLFVLAFRCLYALQTGRLVIIDEFSASIHANISTMIIRLFQDREINKNGAQLVFASHDVGLQKSPTLRRDQIWFSEKREDGSTELYPLSSFGVRADFSIDKAYSQGRFGAVPFLPSEDVLKSFLVKSLHE